MVNVVVGPGSTCGARLVAHPDVAKIAFTGSTEVGRSIAAGAAQTIKRVTLELGGKSPNLVFADADLEAAAAAAPGAVFGNAGQDCCARSRILVQASVLDEFLGLLERTVTAIRVGDPLDETTEMGPLISAGQRETVAGFVPEGAPVAFRGQVPQGPGYWYPPTVLCPVDPADRAAREEIFGPVAVVIPFDDEQEAVRLANDTIYGLSASIWTRDSARSLRVARAVEAGVLSVNSNTSVRVSTPFGGFKQSGYGRELGPHATDAYTEVKSIYVATEGRDAMSGRLQDKVCVITGAAGGIGTATAARFEREGARVVGVDVREHEVGELSLTADLVVEDDVRDLYARIAEEMGGIDVLFNNAGISPPQDASVLDTDLEVWEHVQATNLRSVFLCCKHGIPWLLARGGGSVINTASFVAVMGAATSQIAYTASKGGVLALSRELGVEFAQRGIRVNALCPGPIDTPLLRELYAADPVQAARRMVHVPMGRFGRAEEIANAVLFLASEESSYVNATDFLVDGGLSAAYTTPA